jgi:hypothetical protein
MDWQKYDVERPPKRWKESWIPASIEQARQTGPSPSRNKKKEKNKKAEYKKEKKKVVN